MIQNNDLTAPIIAYERLRFNSDGDGIRTLVAFGGCPLRCKYCLNRQTWDGTGTSKQYTVKQLIDEVKIDSLYFQATNGGITFGGGEPLLYPKFISQFIKEAPSGWNYWVETSLAVPFANILKISSRINKFVVDIKTLDEEIYQTYTGQTVQHAKDNLKKLLLHVGSKKIWVRVPYIEGFMDRKKQKETVKQLKKLGVKTIETFDYIIDLKQK